MSNHPLAYQAVELLELVRAVDATQRVVQLGVFRLGNGEFRSALLSRRSLSFRALDANLVPDTAETRASLAAARAALYGHAADSFRLERVPIPELVPPLPWLPPQDESRSTEIARLESHLDFDKVSEATTSGFAGLGRRFLVSVIPGRDGDIACLLERSVRECDAGDESVQLAHVCNSRREIADSIAQLRAYASSIGAVEIRLS